MIKLYHEINEVPLECNGKVVAHVHLPQLVYTIIFEKQITQTEYTLGETTIRHRIK